MGGKKKKEKRNISKMEEWHLKKKMVAVDILLVHTFKLSE